MTGAFVLCNCLFVEYAKLFQVCFPVLVGLFHLKEHCITKRKKPVLGFNCSLISIQNEIAPCKSADQHDKGRLGQMEISNDGINNLEIIARINENLRPATFALDFVFSCGGLFQRADRSSAYSYDTVA